VDTDSNYASLLVWWDVVHGTRRLAEPRDTITVGVPAWRHPADLIFGSLLAMPFRTQRDDWLATTNALPALAGRGPWEPAPGSRAGQSPAASTSGK
jgi:hypothetical protein